MSSKNEVECDTCGLRKDASDLFSEKKATRGSWLEVKIANGVVYDHFIGRGHQWRRHFCSWQCFVVWTLGHEGESY